MKLVLIFGNLIAAACLVLLGGMASAAHRTHAFSIYSEFVHERVLLERPEYDVAERLEMIAAGGLYYRWLAWLGAGACLTNAALVGACFPKRVATVVSTGAGAARGN